MIKSQYLTRAFESDFIFGSVYFFDSENILNATQFSNIKRRLNELYNEYIQEIKLRRKIHSRYMMLRGNMRIMCRIRPLINSEDNISNKKYFNENVKIFNDSITFSNINSNSNINVNVKDSLPYSHSHTHSQYKKYELDYVFNQYHNQQDIYDEVSILVQNMKTETNICVFAYGQTSTGKTYSIEGPNRTNPGITLRAAKELFKMASEFKHNKFKISLTIVEVYNENIYNLLEDGTPQMSLYENSNGNLNVPDLNPISIGSYEEAVKLCTLARKLRYTNQNLYNERSSRSHCIYTFHLKFIEGDESRKSKLHIIDLAGSERLSKNNLYDDNMRKEAISINLSLNSLSNVLNAICLKQNHIPYRESKLTHFLKESLTENFNILLMLHISPKQNDLGESLSTLEFGVRLGKFCKYKTGKEKSKTHSLPPTQRSNKFNNNY